jgi:hypothetical protein
VVRFLFDADEGHDTGTEMIDIVYDNGGELLFLCETGDASFARRHNDYCEVIGTIKDKKLLKKFSKSYLKQIELHTLEFRAPGLRLCL